MWASGKPLHSQFHYLFLICCLHFLSLCLLKEVWQHLSRLLGFTVASSEWELYVLTSDLMLGAASLSSSCIISLSEVWKQRRGHTAPPSSDSFHGWLSLSGILSPLCLRPCGTLPTTLSRRQFKTTLKWPLWRRSLIWARAKKLQAFAVSNMLLFMQS